MNNQIHFSCNKCGGCCNKPPRVNFYEMLELSNEFIWRACHNVFISTAKNPLEKNKIEQLQNIGHTIVVPEHDLSFFYYIDFEPIQFKNNSNCSKLSQDNLCSIYGKRPARCRISPFNILSDEHSQSENILFFKKQSEKKVWNCSFDINSTLIYENSNFSQNHHQSLYYQEIFQIRDITDKFIEFLDIQENQGKQNHFETLFNYSFKNKISSIYSDLDFLLHMGLYYNMIDDLYVNKFLNSQIKLLNNFIENKQVDKETYKEYIKLKEKYSNFLEKNYFSELYNLQ